VTLDISGLNDNSVFGLVILGNFSVYPDSAFTFQTNNFVMPFTLKGGNISTSVNNAKTAFLTVQKGEQRASVGKETIPGGRFSYSDSRTISAATYDSMGLSGTVLDTTQPVTTSFQLSGVKTGPVNSRISFVLDGIESGTVQIVVYENNAQVFSKNIPIGSQEPGTSPQDYPATPVTILLFPLCFAVALFLYKQLQ